jgi:steroid delta-isomerase-like uncharacterized protein
MVACCGRRVFQAANASRWAAHTKFGFNKREKFRLLLFRRKTMLLEENKALIQKWLAAWLTNDTEQIQHLFAQDYTVNEAPIGVEGVKQAVQFLHTAFSEISAEANEIVAEDDKVVLRWTVRGKQVGGFMGIPPTGKIVELQGINIYHIRDARIRANFEQTNILQVVQELKTA